MHDRVACLRNMRISATWVGEGLRGLILEIYFRVMRSRTLPTEMPAKQMTLFRLWWPETMLTDERGTSNTSARNRMQASLARLSTEGAVKAIFSASLSSPTIAFRLARGWTRIENVTPALVSFKAITSYYDKRRSSAKGP